MSRVLIPSPTFIRAARKFAKRDADRADAIRTTLRLLGEDAFDARLRTHKLKGRLEGCWASSGGYDVRIVFQFVRHRGAEAILLLSVGAHDEVY